MVGSFLPCCVSIPHRTDYFLQTITLVFPSYTRALGCLLFEVSALQPPFDASNQLTLAMKISEGKFADLPGHFSKDLYAVIKWMLQISIENRPRIDDLERLNQIRPYIREYKLNIRENQLRLFIEKYNSKYQEVKSRSDSISQQEMELKQWEDDLANKESDLLARQKRVSVLLTATSKLHGDSFDPHHLRIPLQERGTIYSSSECGIPASSSLSSGPTISLFRRQSLPPTLR
jgi:hypothetical protein